MKHYMTSRGLTFCGKTRCDLTEDPAEVDCQLCADALFILGRRASRHSRLRNDLAVQAAKSLDAKIEAAIRAAFDAGMDFVRSANLTYDAGDPFDPRRPLHEAIVHTISYQGGPIEPSKETPLQFVRYERPKDWRAGQSLR